MDSRKTTADVGQLIDEVVRTITDVDTIKALADPTRLAILRALSRDRMPKSAKELAEDLGQPQTKLYRHLKVLQEAGLIEPAETRVVSGIVETKYRAMQSSVTIDPTANLDEVRDAMVNLVAGNLDDFRERYVAGMRLVPGDEDPQDMKKRGMVMNLSGTVSAEVYKDFTNRLQELVAEFDGYPRDPEGVRLEGMIAWFSPQDPAGRTASKSESA
jgi:DNA-binding transcriptional ArsR family regulator